MAWEFDNDAANYLQVNAAPVSSGPLTLFAWARPVASREQTILEVGEAGQITGIRLQGNIANLARCEINDDDDDGSVGNASGFTNDVWHSVCGVFHSTTSRFCYIDGLTAGEGTFEVAWPTAMDVTMIGVENAATLVTPFEGGIAEAAIWNLALTLAESDMLAAGMTPLMVRPDALVGYWPLHSREGRG